MTYLDLVNAVMRRLREREVTTVQSSGTANSYARLIGDFVNEAKSQVEAAWAWDQLLDTVTVATVNNAFSYELVGATNDFTTLDVINDTSNIILEQRSKEWFNEVFLTGEPVQRGIPAFYNFNGFTSDGNLIMDIYPVPDGVYNIRVNGFYRPADLVNDSDVLNVPSRPVILLATAMAIEERGEDGGTQSVNAYAMARSALADSIAFDAARKPEETTWYSV